ncbi:MAG: TRAP transporter small permease [Gammaproteobacteria bacterium]|nr:TRAP transporter small permease [Gammaproteobacteria bacterium]MCW8840630.1 TRAP transporter small permease [Gammaproteobacteria bacterium]MCW8928099.1 TRAP transporter small permease [Gammaproteobacteria bacterium]MCW8959850.1 TRAP transporter small permease [Gammaproteobacteria bacterium]MCW8973032.1 TRAP transporter small permease [Gammaproteobacteria bacterium]
MLRHIVTLLQRTEEAIITLLLGTMILLAGTQILLRNLWDSGIAWGDPLLRVLVLWIGLLGAMLATRQNRHIRIDILTRHLPVAWQRYSDLLINLFSSAICALLAWHSGRFVYYEWQYGSEIFSGFPAWLAELVMPVGFAVISLRFTLLAWQSFKDKRA